MVGAGRVVALLVLAVAVAGCIELPGLGSDDPTTAPDADQSASTAPSADASVAASSDGPAVPPPDAGEVVATTTSPVHPGIELGLREPLQFDDGTVRLAVDVANHSNDEVSLDDAVPIRDRHLLVRLVDEQGPSRHWPVLSGERDRCLCSGYDDEIDVASGDTVTIEAWFTGMRQVETVRVEPWHYRPVDGLPVRAVDAPAPSSREVSVPVLGNPALTVTTESVTPTPDGTVVRVRYTNAEAPQPVDFDEFPRPAWFHLVDLDGLATYGRIEVDDEAVTNLPAEPEPLAVGEELVFDVLFPTLAPSVSAVRLGSPALPLGSPIALAEAGQLPDGLVVPTNPDEPANDELEGPSERYDTPLVSFDEVERIPIEASGVSVPRPEVAATLTSEAQPGWSIDVRAVVRGPGPYSTLLLDLTHVEGSDAPSTWPEGLGVDGEWDLGQVAVVDQAGKQRIEVLRSGETALSAAEREGGFSEGQRKALYAILPPVSPEATAVVVDVPNFGQAENVPVVELVDGSGDAAAASLRARDVEGLRRDVLAVSRLPEGNGTLVRFRDVNATNPDNFEAPFDDAVCDMRLFDPASSSTFDVLEPCTTTEWDADLGVGQGLVFEVRFPNLPPGVENVVVLAEDHMPSGPVPVGTDARPWYLMVPDDAEASSGAVYSGGIGPADGAQVVRQEEQEVEVTLSNDVLFAFDSAELSDRAAGVIDQLTTRLEEDAVAGTVNVVGHTDGTGTDAYNDELSLQRAQTVQQALDQRLDRPDLTLEVEGRGSDEPVAPNEINGRDNPDGRARNRRVTITYTVNE